MRDNNRRTSGRAALAGTVLISALSLGAAPAMAPAAAATAVTGSTTPGAAQRVIVLLRDQHTGRAVAGDQAPVVSRLKDAGAGAVTRMTLVNAVATTLKPAAIARIRADRQVAAVVPDLPVELPDARDRADAAVAAAKSATAAGSASADDLCPDDPEHPLTEPEALSLTRTDAAQRLATGKGVKVAFFGDGVDVDNPEFVRPDGSHVITDYQDFSGAGVDAVTDGSEGFNSSSAIGAQGSRVYDMSEQLPHAGLPKGCTFRIRGFAPDADLMDLKGSYYTSTVIRAIQYAVDHGADVLSQSLGSNAYPDAATDPLRLADRAAVAAGVTVVASSGDDGTSGTVGSPASDPEVIAAGASTSFRMAAQAYGYPGWTSDNVAALSSGGTTMGNKVVDLVAPGMVGMAACTVDPRWSSCTLPTMVGGGTSQSAPFIAGAAADVIQAYRDTHAGVRPSPGLVKRILTGTATDLGAPAAEQGAGLLNTDAAVRAARALGAPGGDADSDGLVPSTGQLDLTGQPGTTEHSAVTLTNTSDRPQRVTMSSRTTGSQIFRTERTLTIGKPLHGDPREGKLATEPFNIQVPSGTPLLDATMVWPGTAGSGKLAVFLIDPKGRLAQVSYDYDGTGDFSNFQHVDVSDPIAGTWTVKVVWNNGRMHLQEPPLEPGSYRGKARIRITGSRWTSAGVPEQTRVVPAGGTATFDAAVPMPGTAGDTPFSLRFDSGTGTRLSLPVARRTLIPTGAAPGESTSFTATITGGVGRTVGQTSGFFLDVPAGRRSMTIDLTAEDSAAELVYYLVSPEGQILARDTNRSLEDGGPVKSATLTVNRPATGRWTLIVGLPHNISGKDFSQEVRGQVRFDDVKITAPGLPDSPAQVVKRGSSLTVTVSVPNPGPVYREYFLDPRLDTTAELPLPVLGDQDAKDTVTLPDGNPLSWWVPSHTTQLRATATSDVPVDLALYPWTGAPQVLGFAGPGGTTTATAAAGELTSGLWTTGVNEPGPFGTGKAAKGTAKLAVTAVTQAFDPGAKASTGQYWDMTQDWQPVSAKPGKTATMTLTLTPTAPVGTVVRGTLYVDSDSAFSSISNGSELIGIPYTYTVG